MTTTHLDERRIDPNLGERPTETALNRRPTVSVEFKTGDEPEFRTPDHDPHGESFAAVSHSSATCDMPGCETRGLVPTALLEDADGLTGWPPFDIVCAACGDTLDQYDSAFD